MRLVPEPKDCVVQVYADKIDSLDIRLFTDELSPEVHNGFMDDPLGTSPPFRDDSDQLKSFDIVR